MVWHKSSQDWLFWPMKFHIWTLKYVQYVHEQIEEKIYSHLWLKKKKYLIRYNGRKLSFKIHALKILLTAGATILKLRFGHIAENDTSTFYLKKKSILSSRIGENQEKRFLFLK